jgi:hypothetical protein
VNDTPADAPVALPPLVVVVQRLADVSPSWAAVAVQPGSAPAITPLPGIARDRTIGVEAIREGWLLHRGASRVATAASPDLALLIGDWCYAEGLCAITDHGTLDDVAALATLIADVSTRADESPSELESRWTDTTSTLSHTA